MSQRSWGKCAASGAHGPGMDNWERLADARAALQWAYLKVLKQLKKGYMHASPAAQALYDAASAATAAPQSGGGAAADPVAPNAADPVVAPIAPRESDAVAPRRAPARAHHPKLLDSRGEVGAAAALLVALHRAHMAGVTPLSQTELQRRAAPLCPAHALGPVAALRGGSARRLDKGRRAMAGGNRTGLSQPRHSCRCLESGSRHCPQAQAHAAIISSSYPLRPSRGSNGRHDEGVASELPGCAAGLCARCALCSDRHRRRDSPSGPGAPPGYSEPPQPHCSVEHSAGGWALPPAHWCIGAAHSAWLGLGLAWRRLPRVPLGTRQVLAARLASSPARRWQRRWMRSCNCGRRRQRRWW